MPQTVTKATPALEILLDRGGSPYPYRPGDVIIGRVVRSAPIVSARAWLVIRLHGRSKSKMTVRRGQSTSIYRGRFNFFNPHQNQQHLFDGPIHIPPDGTAQAWPFAVTVPAGLDPSTVATGNDKRHSYLPLDPHHVATHPIPPVFQASGVWATTRYECFVEYFLEASLHVESSSGSASTATLPVNITPASTPGLMNDFRLCRRAFLCRIATHRLTPGLESADLSFHQRTQKFFGSSKVPQFAFSLQVDCPRALQLRNPNPIPFRLLVTPNREQTTDAIRDADQTVTLTAMHFEIRAATEVICPGTLSSHTAGGTQKAGFDLKPASARLGAPIVLPSGSKAEPLDVGELLGLTITTVGPLGHGLFSSYNALLYPSFETYNIRHSHRLKFQLTVAVAGESTKLSSELDITVLPLSGAPLLSDLPPPLSDLPPPAAKGEELPAYEPPAYESPGEEGDWPAEKGKGKEKEKE